ncbi:hypothetical protein U1Q18_015344 [Sarracenia purpurea var. burkii]
MVLSKENNGGRDEEGFLVGGFGVGDSKGGADVASGLAWRGWWWQGKEERRSWGGELVPFYARELAGVLYLLVAEPLSIWWMIVIRFFKAVRGKQLTKYLLGCLKKKECTSSQSNNIQRIF